MVSNYILLSYIVLLLKTAFLNDLEIGKFRRGLTSLCARISEKGEKMKWKWFVLHGTESEKRKGKEIILQGCRP